MGGGNPAHGDIHMIVKCNPPEKNSIHIYVPPPNLILITGCLAGEAVGGAVAPRIKFCDNAFCHVFVVGMALDPADCMLAGRGRGPQPI